MRTIFACLIVLIVILLAGILAVQIYFILYQDAAKAQTLFDMNQSIKIFGWSLWELLNPILQLALILAVLVFFFNSSGLARRLLEQRVSGNVLSTQSVIALIIIGSFAIAALTRPEAAAQLKEIALVVVGFYFGTRQRNAERGDTAEIAPGDGGLPAGPGATGASASPAPGPAAGPPDTRPPA